MDKRFAGKVVIVAGGAGGLGRAVSLALLDEGAKVATPYWVEEEWASLRRVAAGNAGSLTGQRIDVTDMAAVQRFVEQVVAEQGGVDALVNTVGGYAGGVNLWEMDGALLDRMLALNLRSGFALAHAVAPVMLKQKRGAIVNIAAKAAWDHAAGAAAYAASKAAALALMDSLAADVKGSGVRVNSILPSIIDTEANRKAMPGSNFAKWPKPEEIARVILFLCSDEAKVVHGAAVPVFGES